MNNDIRNRVAEIISAGLVSGLGKPVPGQLCLEAAVCLALGEPHGDQPSCVAEPDRNFAIRLQDAFPGTAEDRAALFLPLGLAQLGTAGSDRLPWVKLVVEGTIRKVVPLYLRAAAKAQQNAEHRDNLIAAASRCEREGTREAAVAAKTIAYAAYAADAAAYAADAADAAYAADADAAYAADAAAYAADAADAAYAAAYAAADADAAYAAASAKRRQAIEISVAIALEAYKAEGRE